MLKSDFFLIMKARLVGEGPVLSLLVPSDANTKLRRFSGTGMHYSVEIRGEDAGLNFIRQLPFTVCFVTVRFRPPIDELQVELCSFELPKIPKQRTPTWTLQSLFTKNIR